jgi:predicted metal-dependent phosphoesterase TrpH
MTYYVDLHTHSIYSDGTMTPTQLVSLAADAGIKAIALCDHDSLSGIDEALIAGNNSDIEVIPAVELSVQHKNYSDIHLLGYYIDHHDPAFSQKMNEFRQRRETRGVTLINRLNKVLLKEGKTPLSFENIADNVEGAFGRPHIGRALIESGSAVNMQDAFDRYLEPYNVPKIYLPIEEGLAEIKRLGGLSVLAHPVSITRDLNLLQKIIKELAEIGLDGLEVYNNMSNKQETEQLQGIANRLGLAITGGSDFHGTEGDVEIGKVHGCPISSKQVTINSYLSQPNNVKTH